MIQELEIFIQILLAAFFGGIIGLEREIGKKGAGLKTYTLVCLGSAVFSIVAIYGVRAMSLESTNISFDPSRIVQAVATGIGFIGAGSIIFRGDRIEGLTTAAGLWVVAAVGVAVSFKLYYLAFFTSLLSVFIFLILRIVEQKYIRHNVSK